MSQTSPIEQTAGNRLVFEESTEVAAPVSEVYRRWTDFTHFPDFMDNVQEVRAIGADRYHWVARIFGIRQEWDAEVTEREPLRRVAWRSVNGAYNAGTVSLSELPNGHTEVRVRLEYSPPGGQAGQKLEQMGQLTRREVKQDLDNFSRVVSGNMTFTGEPQSSKGFGRVLASLSIPAAFGVAAGAGAWFLEEDLLKSRGAIKTSRAISKALSPVSREAKIASWVFTGLGIGSVISSATLRALGRRNDALFVGQWAPTLVEASLLSRFIGLRELPHPVLNAASYAFAGASLGSIVPSVVTHVRGSRSDGLFIGQWAPTFLGLSLLMRLVNR